MRIVLLSDHIPPEHSGGAEKIAWSLAVGLQRAGHDVHVITTTTGKPFRELRDTVHTYHLYSQQPMRFQAYWGIYNPQTIPALRQLLRELQPDIVHAHVIHNALSYYTLKIAHDFGIRTVFTAHDAMTVAYGRLTHFVRQDRCDVTSPADYRLPFGYNLRQMHLRYNPLRNLIIRQLLMSSVHTRLAVSEALRQALESNGLHGFDVVHNGVAPDAFQAQPQAVETLRQKLSLQGRKIILFAGRLSTDKGSRQLLGALKLLVQRLPEVALLILTRSDMQQQGLDGDEYRTLANRHIVLGGWLAGAELAAAYALADVVVVPSVYLDPLPTVTLEAMAAGKPVVATCFGGAPEMVADGETGFIVNPFDTQEMAARLYQLLTDGDLWAQTGANGRERVMQHFSLERFVQRMEGIYQAPVITVPFR